MKGNLTGWGIETKWYAKKSGNDGQIKQQKTVKKEQCLTEITSNIFNILIMRDGDIVTNVNSL